jgi:hypothetical protein
VIDVDDQNGTPGLDFADMVRIQSNGHTIPLQFVPVWSGKRIIHRGLDNEETVFQNCKTPPNLHYQIIDSVSQLSLLPQHGQMFHTGENMSAGD